MKKPLLYRKRLIPRENIPLEDDEILYFSDTELITRWHTLKPKPQLHHGISYYALDRGWKISRFYDFAGNFLYWYCDIISTEYIPEENSYIFTDLLADVIIYPDGRIHVVDLDEMKEALQDKLLTADEIVAALGQLDALLRILYGPNSHQWLEELANKMRKICR